jgi:hypothetical protein
MIASVGVACTRPLAHALPQCTPEEIHGLGRSVRRTFFSALIDRTVTPDELRQELLSLIQGWPATVGKQAPAEHLKAIALTESRRSAGSPDKGR